VAINDADINRIQMMIDTALRPSEIVYGKVVKRDESRKLVWLSEFGDQPIPLVGFNGTAKVYIQGVVKLLKIKHEVPKVGQTVVVLRQLGSRRLPKCVGVVLTPGGFQAQ
jgi:hypothetical protein